MDYREALTLLDTLQMHKIKLGLDAMRSFLGRVDRPEQKLRCLHVAGTNGKGSVSVSLLTILQRAGYRVGLYTSPHLSSVRERFRIGDRFISEQEFAGYASRVAEALGQDVITYFEFTTAMALLWFAESELDLVILETGLGGRLDATNVVTPLVSVITSISMDHEAYLGNTIEAVTGEKAGIIKEGVPVVATGGQAEVEAVLTRTAAERNAPLYLLDRDFSYSGESNEDWCWHAHNTALGEDIDHLACAMRGAYQRENASLCLAVLRLLAARKLTVAEDMIREGLQEVRWPGRLEYLVLDRKVAGSGEGRVRYLLDGAHNPDGVRNMSLTLEKEYRYERLLLIWGAMIDKDIAGGLKSVLPLAHTLILTRPEGERSAEPAQLAAHLPPNLHKKVILERDVETALVKAEAEAGPDDLIVVAGSLYLVGAVRASLVGQLVDN